MSEMILSRFFSALSSILIGFFGELSRVYSKPYQGAKVEHLER